MRFTIEGRDVEYDEGSGHVAGDQTLVSVVRDAVAEGARCGCNYWADIRADLSTEWTAYLTICGALTQAFGYAPSVDRVPDNPSGYEPEGVID